METTIRTPKATTLLRRGLLALPALLAAVVVVVVSLAVGAVWEPSPALSVPAAATVPPPTPTPTSTPPSGVVFWVNSTGDGGDASPDGTCDDGAGNCTLRAAIQEANYLAGRDTINFSIGTGLPTIAPASALPTISDEVEISGMTQDGGLVELRGTSPTGVIFDGLHITAGNTTVQGLVVNRFRGDGIVLEGSGGNTIRGNLIGTNAAGSVDRGNEGYGVRITGSPNNKVGQAWAVWSGNHISGNTAGGVLVDGAAAAGNTVENNSIGVTLDLASPLGNSGHGVTIAGAPTTTIVANIISANVGSGVHISGSGATGNIVRSNTIGADGTGSTDLGNTQDGVTIQGAPNNAVGEPPDKGNLIVGNDGAGVYISGTGADDNVIQSNGIGVKLNGDPLGNGSHGVYISGSDNLVGGPVPLCTPVYPPCTHVTPATANHIANNGGAGVYVASGSGSGNSIRANNIWDNVALGIDVHPLGATPYDGELTSALWVPGLYDGDFIALTVITGYIRGGPPNTPLVIDVFVSPTCDPSGYGEGQAWKVGTDAAPAWTDANGDMSGAGAFPAGATIGQYATLTLTYPDGSTHEFSNCIQILADSDGDNIQDAVDTIWNEPGHLFSDLPLGGGGTTFGDLIEAGPAGRNGCLVSVVDLPNPEGVIIGSNCLPAEGGGWQGPATVSVCGTGTMTLPHRTAANVKCGSIEITVDIGPVSVEFGTITATLPSEAIVTVTDAGGGNYLVDNQSATTTILVGGLSIGPGANATVQDTDGDGLVDAVETNTGTYVNTGDTGTDPNNSDTDTDGLLDGVEVLTLGTDPHIQDTDVDGCMDGAEAQTATGSQMSGGLRNPLNFWDFFDAPDPNGAPQRNGVININDIFSVAARFATVGDPNGDPLTTPPKIGYHTAYDRTFLGPNPWDLGPPNGAIGINEIFWVAAQFAHVCV